MKEGKMHVRVKMVCWGVFGVVECSGGFCGRLCGGRRLGRLRSVWQGAARLVGRTAAGSGFFFGATVA